MSDTFHLEGGFDLVASVKLTRPHEAGRAFAATRHGTRPPHGSPCAPSPPLDTNPSSP